MTIIFYPMHQWRNNHQTKLVLVSCLIALSLCNCAKDVVEYKTKHEIKQPESNSQLKEHRLIGRVQSRPGQGNFVLVELYGSLVLEAGTPLMAVNAEGKCTKLVVSGEKMSVFLVADLPEGSVAVGDAVYQDVAIKQSSSQSNESAPVKAPPTDTSNSIAKPSS